jgi:hypothetical protein
VSVAGVVPMNKPRSPMSCLVQRSGALARELSPALDRSDQAFNEGVVIADTGHGERGSDAQPVQHGQHRGGLHGRAAFAV